VDKVELAMILAGHKKGVSCLCFGNDNTLIATASKDGFCRLWDINVRYDVREDPKLRLSIDIGRDDLQHIAMTSASSKNNSAQLLVVTALNHLFIYSATTGELLHSVQHAHKGEITQICMTNNGLELMSCSKDFGIKLWNLSSLK